MLIATDFHSVGFSSQRTFILQSMPPSLSFCAEPNGEVAESILQRITLLFRERGDCRMVGEGRGRALSPTPHPPWRAPSPQGEGCSSQSAAMDSATTGKPLVQNDMSEG